MSDIPPQVPQAVVHTRGMRWSWIWLLPLVTALIGGWLAWNTLSQRGPLITISFQSAEGLQAGQSHVRHKDVDMGLVQNVALSPDLQRVIVTVRMNREAEPLLTNTARFWVVKPRFFAGSVSGLETLLSGAYIELHEWRRGCRGGDQGRRDDDCAVVAHRYREPALSLARIERFGFERRLQVAEGSS